MCGGSAVDQQASLDAIMAIFSCCADTAARLLGAALPMRFAAGSILAHQGDDVGVGWIILDGTAAYNATAFDGRTVQMAVFRAGDLMGAYQQTLCLDADIIATAPLDVLQFSVGVLNRLAETDSEIGAGLSRLFFNQLHNMMQRLISRNTLTAPGRIYSVVLAAVDNAGQIMPPPSVSTLAIQAQTTRETASRALAVLDRRGILVRNADSWHLLSRRLLEDLVV
jgi:CRP-like cAMP-binding protein